MTRPPKLGSDVVDAWLAQHDGWAREGEALVRTFKLADFGAALSLAVRVGMQAEKRDHHPDVLIGWGKAKFVWTTHDAGGITALDLELAEATDRFAV
jgi:4a-hydroxytetrahydrobiopterin dehydratase